VLKDTVSSWKLKLALHLINNPPKDEEERVYPILEEPISREINIVLEEAAGAAIREAAKSQCEIA
jgi:hypothetical protein